jgi:hypothetical protein
VRHGLAALLAGVSLLCAATGGAQTYPPTASELEVSTTEVTGGGSVLLRADGFRARADVTIALRSVGALSAVTAEAAPASTVLGVVAADARGTVDTSVEIPADTPPGEAILEARGPGASGGARVVRAVINVVAAERPPRERAEPSAARETAAPRALSIAMVLAAVLALVAAGLSVRHATRKRES